MSSPDTPAASRFVSRRILVACLIFILGVVLFLAVYDGVREKGDLAVWDMPVMTWMQAHQYPTVIAIMRIITDVFSPATIGVATVIWAGVWTWRKKEYWRPLLMTSTVGLAFLLSALIKAYTARARPTMTDLLGTNPGISYSFPSGHTVGIAIFLFILGYFSLASHPTTRRALAWTLITLAGISFVAFSRLYLGYHWLTDVTASVGLAMTVLACAIGADTYRHARHDNITSTKV